MSLMAAYSEHNGRTGIGVEMTEPFKGEVAKAECEGKHAAPHSSKGPNHLKNHEKKLSSSHKAAEINTEDGSGGASFSTNHNSVICLPLVSEGLKLVWTQSDQTRELDVIPELVQAFNVFPYPTSCEVSALARVCALPLDKVKVWFMVQRIKYGISWASEEIEETRQKLTIPFLSNGYTETKSVKTPSTRKGGEEFTIEDKDSEPIGSALLSTIPRLKKTTHVTPEPTKKAQYAAPCFNFALPPPQDSHNYRPPVERQANTAVDVCLDLSQTPSKPQHHRRYKKSKAQLAVLRSSFLIENWPVETELRRLQEETGLSRNDIRKWFSDCRYQLRNGRGGVAAQASLSNSVEGVKDEIQQLQPLSLVARNSRHKQNGSTGHKEVSNGKETSTNGKVSHSLPTLQSSNQNACAEQTVKVEGNEDREDISMHCSNIKKEETQSEEEKPLQLTKPSKECTETPTKPAATTMTFPSPFPSGIQPSTAQPNKRLSNGINTSKKSTRSVKASNSLLACSLSSVPSSTSPALTPAGRPRKTKEQLDILKQHFLRCQWPKSEDYTLLVEQTGLPRADVIQWFGDTRYAVKNGQLRWVQGVREQFLAELTMQQNCSGVTNDYGGSPRSEGSRKRKSPVNRAALSATDSSDVPLQVYLQLNRVLHEKDLDILCKKSKMSYQQVRDWFASQD